VGNALAGGFKAARVTDLCHLSYWYAYG
jgi:hypothetical protein